MTAPVHRPVPSTLATAIRTAVVMTLAWSLVFALGQQHGTIRRPVVC